jgi:hypothetical protein
VIDAGRRDSRLSLFEQERVQARKGSGRKGSGKKGFGQSRVLVSMVGDANNPHAWRRNRLVTKQLAASGRTPEGE